VIYFILFLNCLRFIGLQYSPHGFFLDEAAGASQIMCIAQDGSDFFGKYLPLFAKGFAGQPGQFTPAYLYGQIAWTSIFGYSIAALRAFPAFVTCLTVLVLYQFVKNRVGQKTALYVAFAASVMPWAFQFSRVAWDPPVAVLFLVSFLWAMDRSKSQWLAGIFLALSVYTYPPMRVAGPLLLLAFPNTRFLLKIKILVIFAIACIPLAIKLASPEFMLRANLHGIWSPAFISPYAQYGIFNLPIVFVVQLFKHFDPSFLFISGDPNLRHSSGGFGMLSWLDAFAYLAGLFLLSMKAFKKSFRIFLSPASLSLFQLAIAGIVIATIPAALTNEGIPHGLRSIGAWPFYAVVTGVILSRLDNLASSKQFIWVVVLIGSIFFSIYLRHYFTVYARNSISFFHLRYDDIDYAYKRMYRDGASCAQVRKEPPPIAKIFDFANGKNGGEYLGAHWHDQEPWGRWSDGQFASIRLPLLAGSRYLKIQIVSLVGPAMPSQTISASINGELEKTMTITQPGPTSMVLDIPPNLAANSMLEIVFHVAKPISPAQMGIGSDKRILGVGLVSVEFE
jgi:4-amino-4-deoxy-L-arabinose transferase-like glycosyltransferase